MTRYRGPPRRRGFMNEAIHLGRRALYSTDHFLRSYGPVMKEIAQLAAPTLTGAGFAPAAATVAARAQAADGYASLRQQLGD